MPMRDPILGRLIWICYVHKSFYFVRTHTAVKKVLNKRELTEYLSLFISKGPHTTVVLCSTKKTETIDTNVVVRPFHYGRTTFLSLKKRLDIFRWPLMGTLSFSYKEWIHTMAQIHAAS
jgi:hypothetical protein